METLNFVENGKYVKRAGDLCEAYYIPLVLAGRYRSCLYDIEHILCMWIKGKKHRRIEKGNEEIDEKEKEKEKEEEKKKKKRKKKRKKKDLYSFSLIFKKTLFSLVLMKNKYEHDLCAWQTFWCAWINIFKKSFENNNKYKTQYGKKLIAFQAGCIYLLFLVYFSQYVKMNQRLYPIYLSTDTFNLCLDVTEQCETESRFHELRYILNFLMDTNSIILCYNERISEAFHDRYGFPLYVDKNKLISDCSVEINTVNLRQVNEFIIQDMKEMKDMNEMKDVKDMRDVRDRHIYNNIYNSQYKRQNSKINLTVEKVMKHMHEVEKILGDDNF